MMGNQGRGTMMGNLGRVLPDAVNSWFRKKLRNQRQVLMDLADILKAAKESGQ